MADTKKKASISQGKGYTPIGLVSWPKLAQPEVSAKFGGKPKYNVTLILAKDADLTKLKALCLEAAKIEGGPKVQLKDILLPFRDGDQKDNDPAMKGRWFIKPTSGQKVGIIGPDKTPIGADEVYGGCFATLCVKALAWTKSVKAAK